MRVVSAWPAKVIGSIPAFPGCSRTTIYAQQRLFEDGHTDMYYFGVLYIGECATLAIYGDAPPVTMDKEITHDDDTSAG